MLVEPYPPPSADSQKTPKSEDDIRNALTTVGKTWVARVSNLPKLPETLVSGNFRFFFVGFLQGS